MNINTEEFRLNLKYYRELKGWSQSQLAVQADSSNGQIGNIESGKAFPSFELIFRLAAALDIHPADLFLRNASVSKEKLNHAISTIIQEKIPKLIEEELASI
ncbi:MAG: helix-turn-helix domain-containing protein [Treponema sp.]|nr:helix-turn-helix domain-containing protein [Treponema sp.]